MVLLAAALWAGSVGAAPDEPFPKSIDIPAWAMEVMAETVGRWQADNAAYQSDNEPFDAYGLEWSWSLGQKGLTGRLYGLQDGEEAGTFWQFRQFWHPAEEKLMLYQFGLDGAVGIGTHERLDEHTDQLLQTFYAPDGTRYQVGHRTERREDEHHGRSYTVGDDGTWTENRYYVWHRVR